MVRLSDKASKKLGGKLSRSGFRHKMPGCGQMEPLPYLQGEREEGRAAARRVNIAYTGHDARGAYLGYTNRSLPYLPLEIRELITGYAGPPVAPGQRVGGGVSAGTLAF